MNTAKAYQPKIHFWRNRILLPAVLKVIGLPLVKLKGYRYKNYKPGNKTFMLLANHNENFDPAYEMVGIKGYIRYVTSDHVIRSRVGGRIVAYFGTPIVKHREKPSSVLISDIKDTLAAGVSVALHAEGGTSINGETRPVSQSTAKLIQETDCAVITYRMSGGYLRSPRWASHHRKGPLYGGVVREYDMDELRQMSLGEIHEAICGDLYVNSYDVQREKCFKYSGKALAEHCEIVLYMCPECGGIGTLHSKGGVLRCDCGYEVEMREDGFFHDLGSGLRFDSIRDWDHWQKEAIGIYVDDFAATTDMQLFGDSRQILFRVDGAKRSLISESADILLFRDRLMLRSPEAEMNIPLDKIVKMEYVSKQSLLIITESDYFELRSAAPRSPLKYIDAWRHLMGRSLYY